MQGNQHATGSHPSMQGNQHATGPHPSMQGNQHVAGPHPSMQGNQHATGPHPSTQGNQHASGGQTSRSGNHRAVRNPNQHDDTDVEDLLVNKILHEEHPIKVEDQRVAYTNARSRLCDASTVVVCSVCDELVAIRDADHLMPLVDEPPLSWWNLLSVDTYLAPLVIAEADDPELLIKQYRLPEFGNINSAWHQLLLSPRGVVREGRDSSADSFFARACDNCFHCLNDLGKVPTYAIANGFAIGTPPSEWQPGGDTTISHAEWKLLSPCISFMYVKKERVVPRTERNDLLHLNRPRLVGHGTCFQVGPAVLVNALPQPNPQVFVHLAGPYTPEEKAVATQPIVVRPEHLQYLFERLRMCNQDFADISWMVRDDYDMQIADPNSGEDDLRFISEALLESQPVVTGREHEINSHPDAAIMRHGQMMRIVDDEEEQGMVC
ncbi:hypothetical protein CYMTET_9281 [Cymbomonas tetramitiformis]|uniref:DUF6570 domain-containing protein n=1 Tax=Cymbomonas tetramitiformis TaxID=36881 RepID=A0AAE0GRS7_9CHLO|nr:hypothetical protein CYMTET_9281 [Cymbomonas tetramitiformis]